MRDGRGSPNPGHARRSSVAEELLAIDDGAIDFACRDELTRIVSGAHTEGESAAGGRRWCLSDDLDRAAHRGRASVLDAHGRADGRLARPRELRGGLHRRRLHPRDQPRGCEHRHVAATDAHGGVGIGDFVAHHTTLTGR